MSDLTHRLRTYHPEHCPECFEAADELERLERGLSEAQNDSGWEALVKSEGEIIGRLVAMNDKMQERAESAEAEVERLRKQCDRAFEAGVFEGKHNPKQALEEE